MHGLRRQQKPRFLPPATVRGPEKIAGRRFFPIEAEKRQRADHHPTQPAYFAGGLGAALPAGALGAFACIALRIAGVMSSAAVE